MMMTRSHLKIGIFGRDHLSGVAFRWRRKTCEKTTHPAWWRDPPKADKSSTRILKYVGDLRQGLNADISRKDFFEMVSIIKKHTYYYIIFWLDKADHGWYFASINVSKWKCMVLQCATYWYFYIRDHLKSSPQKLMIKWQNIRCVRFMIVKPFYYSTINSGSVAGLYDFKFKSHLQSSFPAKRQFPGLTFIKELLRIQVAPT